MLLVQGWGMTEAGPAVAVQHFSPSRFKFTSYYDMLYLGCPFCNRSKLCISIVSFRRVFHCIPPSTKNLHSLGSYPLDYLRSIKLSHRSFF